MFRKNVYILGAGFSANAGAPVMRNFVEQAKLLRDDSRLDLPPEDRKTFGKVFTRLGDLRVAQARMNIDIENIEHLFSLIDMGIEFGTESDAVLRDDLVFMILRTLERTIRTSGLSNGEQTLPILLKEDRKIHNRGVLANYVELFSAFSSRRWIQGSLGIPSNGKSQDTVITLNYDCLLDDSLAKLGVRPDYGLTNVEVPYEYQKCPFSMSVLKLHGSANWFRCKSGECGARMTIAGGSPADRLEYFYGQRCSTCSQGTMEPVIVPPTWAKGAQSETLRPVWSEALKALRAAGRIFIIGYSMPATDQFFRYMMGLALAANESLDKIIIVNSSANAQSALEELFQSQFRERKLKKVPKTVEAYTVSNSQSELAMELGQFNAGFDEVLIEQSGFSIR